MQPGRPGCGGAAPAPGSTKEADGPRWGLGTQGAQHGTDVHAHDGAGVRGRCPPPQQHGNPCRQHVCLGWRMCCLHARAPVQRRAFRTRTSSPPLLLSLPGASTKSWRRYRDTRLRPSATGPTVVLLCLLSLPLPSAVISNVASLLLPVFWSHPFQACSRCSFRKSIGTFGTPMPSGLVHILAIPQWYQKTTLGPFI